MKYRLLSLGALALIAPTLHVGAQELSSDNSSLTTTSVKSDATYWAERKTEEQRKSTEMRRATYEKYKTKGYDMSLMTDALLDATLTSESQFWEMMRKIQNIQEVQSRKEYLVKLASKGIDTSVFTDEILGDSVKFWAKVKFLEQENQQRYTEKKKEQEMQKNTQNNEEYKKAVEEKKKAEEKKYSTEEKKYSTEEKKNVTLPTSFERVKKLFIERIEKIPADKKEASLQRLQKNIERQLESARKNSNTMLTMKLEVLLQIVKTKINTEVDDETLVNSLFTE